MADMYDIQNPPEQYYPNSFQPPNPVNKKRRRIIAIVITILVVTGLTAVYLRITRTERIYSEKQLQKEYYKYKRDIDEIISIIKNLMRDDNFYFSVGHNFEGDFKFMIDVAQPTQRDVSDEMSEEEKKLITAFIDQSKFGRVRFENNSLALFCDVGSGWKRASGIVLATDGGDPYVGPGAEFTEFDENVYYFRW